MLKTLNKISVSELLVLILLIIILLQKCGGSPSNPTGPQIVRDTVWVHKDSTIYSKPQIVKIIPVDVHHDSTIKEYLPDTSSMAKLIAQYELLLNKHFEKNIYSDSANIDTVGKVYITDTISGNKIEGRKINYNYKLPFITNTITIPEPKKTQWYFGWDVRGRESELIDQISAGVMIRNKKNHLFGGTIGVGKDNFVRVGLSSYWLIKIK